LLDASHAGVEPPDAEAREQTAADPLHPLGGAVTLKRFELLARRHRWRILRQRGGSSYAGTVRA